MNFSGKNRITLEDLHKILRSIIFPNTVIPTQRFNLTPDDYKFVYHYMSQFPSETLYPPYDSVAYYDAYGKNLLYGSQKGSLPKNIRIFNKEGDAYGHLLDIAYIVDFDKKIEFFLSAEIYCNKDGVMNDDKYDYDSIGYPFMKNLGRVMYDYEIKRKRTHAPDLVKAKLHRLLDSTKDTKIYPVLSTTYQKAKENELNLGLDLQGGMSVTMDVSLEGLIKSLSNNPKDPQLLNALTQATKQKVNSSNDYISLFRDAFKQQNPSANLSSLFAGAGKNIKVTDSDEKVIEQIRTIAKSAIQQTYKILLKRIDKFGVAQPNINLDENKGIISIELAGVTDPVLVLA